MIHLSRPDMLGYWCKNTRDGESTPDIITVTCVDCLQELATQIGRRLRALRPRPGRIDSFACRRCGEHHVVGDPAFDPQKLPAPRVRIKLGSSGEGWTGTVIEWRADQSPIWYRVQFVQLEGVIEGDSAWRGGAYGRANYQPCEIEAIP